MFKQQTRTAKLIAAIWLLIPLLMLAIALYGWKIGDVLGGLLMSLVPLALLIVITTFLSLVAGGVIAKMSKWTWLAASVIALLISIAFANRAASDAIQGAETVLGYVMIIMSFPLGLLAPYIFIGIKSLNITALSSLVVMWAAFSAIGYLQWFVVLPWLWRKLRREPTRAVATQ